MIDVNKEILHWKMISSLKPKCKFAKLDHFEIK